MIYQRFECNAWISGVCGMDDRKIQKELDTVLCQVKVSKG